MKDRSIANSRKSVLTAVGADLAIAVAKFTAFFFTRSSGMLSEAIHSVVDAGNGTLLVLGIHRSEQPADELHPFGYGKEIYFWSLLVALFIFIVGGGFSIFEGINRLRHPEPIDHPLWNYITLVLSACFEGYSLYVGRREFQESEGVPASWQAIHRSKDPATFTVIFEDSASLAGLSIAFLGTLAEQFFGWTFADGVSSILIGSVLLIVAVLLIVESKGLLIGEGADLQTLRKIRALASAEPGVVRVGYPMTMYFGPGVILLTMNVRFDRDATRDGIEATVDRIESTIRTHLPAIKHIYLEAESLRQDADRFDPARLPRYGPPGS